MEELRIVELFAIAITDPADGLSMTATLDRALALLRSAKIRVEGAADVRVAGREMSTILLRSEDDQSEALKLLLDSGLEAKLGPAGF